MSVIIGLFISTLFFLPSFTVYADDDHKQRKNYNKIVDDDDNTVHHQKRKREHKRGDDHSDHSIKTVKNTVYQDVCGECHLAYQPELMPRASWSVLMKNLDGHFGETIELDDASINSISDYLNKNSAENSRAKRGAKIIRSIKNKVPKRITQIPYIVEEHHEISSNVFDREAIGSFSNCAACHLTAEDGIYDDDNVEIPE